MPHPLPSRPRRRPLRAAAGPALLAALAALFAPPTPAPAAPGAPYVVAAGRSPIPAPGETITQPLAAKRLAAEPVGEAPPAGKAVPWTQAHRHVGHRITVEGTIVDTHNHQGRICFLNFHRQWRGKFYLPVFQNVFADLPEPPETYYLNKKIRVTGTVTLHQDRPNIAVRSARQIEIVE